MTRAAALAAVVAFLALDRTPPVPAGRAPDRPQGVAAAVYPFTPGERLEYDVKFGIFHVGRATMQVLGIDTVRGTPAYHVAFVIRGRAAFFYSMTDTLESWFSVADLTSLRFIQNNNENGSRYYHTYEIHADSGYFIQDGKDSLPTTARPLDDASFFYFARTVPLEVGQTYSFDRYFKPDRNPVTLTVLSNDSVDTPAGRFAAIAVRPVFRSRGLFAEGGQAVVYLAADSTRVPLVIKTHLSLGSLSMALRSRR
ncbi:MAG TPA: DUF3108 domain-containing protein [Gemmatimonadales bacterium]|nr:DUF3108 domain-containing protein [Gemmatimonadales bacterium]